MKLNLLPKTISQAKAARAAIVFSIILFALLTGGGVMAMIWSQDQLQKAKDVVADLKPKADQVVANARIAETKMTENASLFRNVALANAMLDHNRKYPELYTSLLPYIPAYYRLQSMNAAPAGPGQSQVTLVGVLKSFQQYADLTLVLRRIPDVMSVSRAGFQPLETYVPGLSADDQIAMPIRPGEGRVPLDPIDRLNYYIAQAQEPGGFVGTGGFGTEDMTTPRGAMPEWSVVTMTLVINRDLQTPDPGATLGSPSGSVGTALGTPGGTGGGAGGAAGGRGGPMGLGGPAAGGPPAGIGFGGAAGGPPPGALGRGGPTGPPAGVGGPPAGAIPGGVGGGR